MASMFQNQSAFNRNIGSWNVSKVASFNFMFGHSIGTGSFNNGNSDSIKNWNMSSSTTIRTMFQRQPYFNREIGLWNISNATDIGFLIGGAVDKAFTNAGSPSIGSWNTSKVTNMTGMFVGCYLFDQNLGAWNTSNVTSMLSLFYCSGIPGIFNNSGSTTINNWNTSKVTDMSGLFRNQALFNQPVNSWDTSKVVDMSNVFVSATSFNQPLSNWNVSSSTTVANFMFGKTFNDYSTANYDALLIGWASRPVKPNLSTNFGSIRYTAAASASRAILTSAPNNWTITDGGQV
jgi:surface protein